MSPCQGWKSLARAHLDTKYVRFANYPSKNIGIICEKKSKPLCVSTSVIMKRKQDSTMDKENYSVSQKFMRNNLFCLHQMSVPSLFPFTSLTQLKETGNPLKSEQDLNE